MKCPQMYGKDCLLDACVASSSEENEIRIYDDTRPNKREWKTEVGWWIFKRYEKGLIETTELHVIRRLKQIVLSCTKFKSHLSVSETLKEDNLDSWEERPHSNWLFYCPSNQTAISEVEE